MAVSRTSFMSFSYPESPERGIQTPWSPTMTVLALFLGCFVFASPAFAGDSSHPFPCCSNTNVTAVLDEYLDLHDALVAGESPNRFLYGIREKAKALANTGNLNNKDRKVARRLSLEVDGIRDAQIPAILEKLPSVTTKVAHLVLNHEGGTQLVVEAYCPEGKIWLQRDPESPQNPYGTEECGQWR